MTRANAEGVLPAMRMNYKRKKKWHRRELSPGRPVDRQTCYHFHRIVALVLGADLVVRNVYASKAKLCGNFTPPEWIKGVDLAINQKRNLPSIDPYYLTSTS